MRRRLALVHGLAGVLAVVGAGCQTAAWRTGFPFSVADIDLTTFVRGRRFDAAHALLAARFEQTIKPANRGEEFLQLNMLERSGEPDVGYLLFNNLDRYLGFSDGTHRALLIAALFGVGSPDRVRAFGRAWDSNFPQAISQRDPEAISAISGLIIVASSTRDPRLSPYIKQVLESHSTFDAWTLRSALGAACRMDAPELRATLDALGREIIPVWREQLSAVDARGSFAWRLMGALTAWGLHDYSQELWRAATDDSNGRRREVAVGALGLLARSDDRAFSMLVQTRDELTPVYGFSMSERPQAIPHLEKIALNRSMDDAEGAVLALRDFGSPHVLPAMQRLALCFHNADGHVEAIAYLGKSGDPESKRILQRGLADAPHPLMGEFLLAYGGHATLAEAELFLDHMNDSDEFIRFGAAIGLFRVLSRLRRGETR